MMLLMTTVELLAGNQNLAETFLLEPNKGDVCFSQILIEIQNPKIKVRK